jgi:hypothetical protein
MAINGQVVIKPMMYLALSYDHRIIDGRESVSFLVRVKELLENPALLLFGKDPLKVFWKYNTVKKLNFYGWLIPAVYFLYKNESFSLLYQYGKKFN